jgi:phage shock protein C
MMQNHRNTFHLDKPNAKWLGVCAGIARYTGIDLTLLRIITVLSTLFLTGGTLLIAYVIVALIAPSRPETLS